MKIIQHLIFENVNILEIREHLPFFRALPKLISIVTPVSLTTSGIIFLHYLQLYHFESFFLGGELCLCEVEASGASGAGTREESEQGDLQLVCAC